MAFFDIAKQMAKSTALASTSVQKAGIRKQMHNIWAEATKHHQRKCVRPHLRKAVAALKVNDLLNARRHVSGAREHLAGMPAKKGSHFSSDFGCCIAGDVTDHGFGISG